MARVVRFSAALAPFCRLNVSHLRRHDSVSHNEKRRKDRDRDKALSALASSEFRLKSDSIVGKSGFWDPNRY